MSESRPISSHSHYLYPPATSIFAQSSSQFDAPMPREGKFQSSFARCLNMPSMAMDQLTWLENELLDTRQVLYYFILSNKRTGTNYRILRKNLDQGSMIIFDQ